MKIAWFTPFDIKSAIGKYSQIATNELSKNHQIDLWLSDTKNPHPTNLNIVKYSTDPKIKEKYIDSLNEYDLIVYNLGNNNAFHDDIYKMSKKVKGIVIIHDYIMHHFFVSDYLNNDQQSQYISEMHRLYGEEGKQAAQKSFEENGQRIWEDSDVVKFPMFEKIIDNSLGIITHSDFATNIIKEKQTSPIKTIYFPFEHKKSGLSTSEAKTKLKLNKKKTTILSFGHINRYKRLETIIKALGQLPEIQNDIEYIIIGSCGDQTYIEQIENKIKQNDLQNTVKMLGYQPEEVLNSHIQAADIFVNLRNPTTESASWSIMEQLYSGKPSIASDNGFYSELPDNCIIKIDPKNELEELKKALNLLINDKNLRTKIGSNAKEFAYKAFNTQSYCQSFINFANKVLQNKKIINQLDSLIEELNKIGAHKNQNLINTITEEYTNLFYGDAENEPWFTPED